MPATFQFALAVLGIAAAAVLVPSAAEIQPCTSLVGTNDIRNYVRGSRSLVIEVQCSTPIGFAGHSSGQVRLRKLYICKEGMAERVGPLSRRRYRCPTPAALATTPPAPATTPPAPASPSTQPSMPPQTRPQPTTASTNPPPPPTRPPTPPRGQDPLCSEIEGKSRNAFTTDSQSKLCATTCRVPVSYFGFPAGFRSRTVYNCCTGTATASGSRSLLTCL